MTPADFPRHHQTSLIKASTALSLSRSLALALSGAVSRGRAALCVLSALHGRARGAVAPSGRFAQMPNHEISAALLSNDDQTASGAPGAWAGATTGGASAIDDFARTHVASSRKLIPQGWQKPLAVLGAVLAMSLLMWLMPGAQTQRSNIAPPPARLPTHSWPRLRWPLQRRSRPRCLPRRIAARGRGRGWIGRGARRKRSSFATA